MAVHGAAMSVDPDIAIAVEHLTKDFRVLHRAHASLKTAAAEVVKSLLRRASGSGFESRRVLDDVSFQLRRGESVVVLGSNGSGKSTLLSILSRVYLPTAGEARITGRLISLLELGAGFNLE